MSAKLSPFGTPLEDLTFWCKEYIGRKIATLSSRVVDTESAKKITALRHTMKIPTKTLDDVDGITKEVARLGQKSVRNYAVIVIDFIRFCVNDRKITSIKDISSALVQEDYFGSKRFKSIKTKKNYYRHVVAFMEFIEAQNYVNDDGAGYRFGMEQMPRSYDGEKIPETLYPEEFVKYIGFLENNYVCKNAVQTQRNRLMLKILCYTGLRSSEILSIARKSIGYMGIDGLIPIKVVGKGDKEIITYLEASIFENELNAWLNQIDEKETSLLFDLTTQAFHYIVKQSLIIAGVKKDKKGPHLFRHSYATYLLSTGVGLEQVRKLLNHVTIMTTSIYAKVGDSDLRKTAKEFGKNVHQTNSSGVPE